MKILNENNYKFLFYKDGFKVQGSWLTVHRTDPMNTMIGDNETSEILINSALVSETLVNKIKNSNKEVNFYEGYQSFSNSIGKDDFEVTIGYCLNNEIRFYPLVYSRPSIGQYDVALDINQNFIIYHDLRRQGNDYFEPNSETKVIQINGTTIQVNFIYLKDYLAKNKMCLIRYFGLFRSIKNKLIKEIVTIPNNRYESETTEDNYYLKLIVGDHMRNYANSFLDGKQIIYSHDQL